MLVEVAVAICSPTALTSQKNQAQTLSLPAASSSQYSTLLGMELSDVHQNESSPVH